MGLPNFSHNFSEYVIHPGDAAVIGRRGLKHEKVMVNVMTIIQSARSRTRGFVEDESAAMLVFALFLFIAMLLGGGMAVDFMRVEDQRARLQATLDRAVLAAAYPDETRDAEEIARDYFAREGLDQYVQDIQVVEDEAGRAVTVEASFESDTFFLHMIGLDTLSVVAQGTASERTPNLEISLVLDISGSMRFDDRIGDLKPAAKEFVAAVLDPAYEDHISINLVPYAGQTNPGPEMFAYLGGVRRGSYNGDNFEEWPQDISNAVVYYDTMGNGVIDTAVKVDGFPDGSSANHISNDLDDFFGELANFISDSVPSVGDATLMGASIKGGLSDNAYYAVENNTNGNAPDDGPTENTGKPSASSGIDTFEELNYSDFTYAPTASIPSSCLELSNDDFGVSALPDNGYYEQVPHFMYWDIAADVMDWGWCPEDDTAIQYAQQDEETLDNFIDALRMHDGTGTHYGMKYALALLDPSSQGAFDYLANEGVVPEEFRDRPLAWDAAGSAKYIVLMTDGIITEQWRPTNPDDPQNATVELENRPSSDRKQITSAATNVNSFYSVCDEAKNAGVIVFTIAYEAGTTASEQMQTCASSPSHFFEASQEDIGETFSAIADKINQLRLIQ
jgi:Flp pilus assembly protein TadG